MAYHALDSKLDRAIVAYLVSVGGFDTNKTHPALRSLNAPLPCTIVHTTSLGMPAGDAFSGSRTFETDIIILATPFAASSSDAARQEFNESAGNVADMMNNYGQSSDLLCDAINTAAYERAAAENSTDTDLADFALNFIEPAGEIQGFNQQGSWQKKFTFRGEVCAVNQEEE